MRIRKDERGQHQENVYRLGASQSLTTAATAVNTAAYAADCVVRVSCESGQVHLAVGVGVTATIQNAHLAPGQSILLFVAAGERISTINTSGAGLCTATILN